MRKHLSGERKRKKITPQWREAEKGNNTSVERGRGRR